MARKKTKNEFEPNALLAEAKDFFDKAEIPKIFLRDDSLVVDDVNAGDLLKFDGGKCIVYFYRYDRDASTYQVGNPTHQVTFDHDIPLSDLFFLRPRRYELSYDKIMRSILNIPFEVTKIEISKSFKGYKQTNEDTLQISYDLFCELKRDSSLLFAQVKRYKNSTQRYLTNQNTKKYTGKSVELTTFLQKDEFDFLVHKLNLKTKKKRDDYKKYLSDNDIQALQSLTLSLIDKEVFDEHFLKKLDEYFIREKLKDILKIGRNILSLRSGDLKTEKAKAIIKSLGLTGRSVKQLETLWQRFFEKYLLYLIFTYKEVYPKVKLRLDSDDKAPDFIGINHYYGVDIIEIKTHLAGVLTWDSSHKNYAFSTDMSKAIIQTMNYLDAVKAKRFKSSIEERRITETTFPENLYNPRGIIIISSTERLVKSSKKKDHEKIKRDFTKLRSCLNGIEILTFDEVLDIAENYLEKIVKQNA